MTKNKTVRTIMLMPYIDTYKEKYTPHKRTHFLTGEIRYNF